MFGYRSSSRSTSIALADRTSQLSAFLPLDSLHTGNHSIHDLEGCGLEGCGLEGCGLEGCNTLTSSASSQSCEPTGLGHDKLEGSVLPPGRGGGLGLQEVVSKEEMAGEGRRSNGAIIK